MRARELALLEAHHWHGPAPEGFRQEHDEMIANEFNNTDVLMLVAIGILLLIVLIFLAVAEMGLSRMSKPRAGSLADKGRASRARRSSGWSSEPERWVNPLLLTVNICQTVQATLTGIVAGPPVRRLPASRRCGAQRGRVLRAGRGGAQDLRRAVPAARGEAGGPAGQSALVAFPPLRWISRGADQAHQRHRARQGPGEAGPFVSEQELLGIVEVAAEDGVVEHEERELIESIIEFGDTVAREVMVPRPDIVVIEHSCHASPRRSTSRSSEGYSRLPVLNPDEDDDVLGLAYTKDLMRTEREGGGAGPSPSSSGRCTSCRRTSRSTA
jgi:putative hemolysin